MEFNRKFPYYEQLTLKCQWLHKEKLGRISNVQKNSYTIQFWEKQLPAKLKGSFYKGNQTFPIVGDYVTFEYNPKGDARILEVCERRSVLKRPFPRDHAVRNVKEQEMVANVDFLFIVTSLNNDFSVNRVLRYETMAKQGGVKPVIILTKVDLCNHVEKLREEMEAATFDTPIHAISAAQGIGMDEIKEYMKPGTTIALMGSSGVGKSTLLNALVGGNFMETMGVREKDAKGRHTTTYRQMFTLPSGVTIIDTPGMRELGLGDVTEGLDETFEDIVALARMCKFNDCRHKTEPGCAVKKAISEGKLDEKRWKNYQKLTPMKK